MHSYCLKIIEYLDQEMIQIMSQFLRAKTEPEAHKEAEKTLKKLKLSKNERPEIWVYFKGKFQRVIELNNGKL